MAHDPSKNRDDTIVAIQRTLLRLSKVQKALGGQKIPTIPDGNIDSLTRQAIGVSTLFRQGGVARSTLTDAAEILVQHQITDRKATLVSDMGFTGHFYEAVTKLTPSGGQVAAA